MVTETPNTQLCKLYELFCYLNNYFEVLHFLKDLNTSDFMVIHCSPFHHALVSLGTKLVHV